MSNFNLRQLEAHIHSSAKGVARHGEEIVTDYAHTGEKLMEQFIEDAETATGQARSGRASPPSGSSTSPGRIDSGLMINQVNSHTDINEKVAEGLFGWTGVTEKYFDYQENGTKKIEAMNALSGAHTIAVEKAKSDIIAITKGTYK